VDETARTLQQLCRWAVATRLQDIPADVTARTGMIAADTIACALGASADTELADWTRLPIDAADDGQCTALGKPGTHPSPTAAAYNAIAANWLQLDEGHHHLMCHAGIYCVPAGLAECEARDDSLAVFVRAVALGYEMTCRLARAATFRAAPVHPHSLWSIFGATATLGLLRGLDSAALLQALLHAATFAAPRPFAVVGDGGLAANLWVGAGIDQAFSCTAWAQAGLRAPAHAFTHLGNMLGASTDPAVHTKMLGQDWAVRQNYFKNLACAGQSHAAMEALLEARASLIRQGIEVFDEAALIEAEVHDFAVTMAQHDIPSSLAARFSIPHLLSVAWLHGRSDAQALGAEFLGDPQVACLRKTVRLRPLRPALAPPHHRAARVTITLAGGQAAQHLCLAPLGSQARPFEPADLQRKCLALAQGRQATLLGALLDLPSRLGEMDAMRVRAMLRSSEPLD